MPCLVVSVSVLGSCCVVGVGRLWSGSCVSWSVYTGWLRVVCVACVAAVSSVMFRYGIVGVPCSCVPRVVSVVLPCGVVAYVWVVLSCVCVACVRVFGLCCVLLALDIVRVC